MSAALEPTSCKEAEPFALQIRDDSMAPEFWPGCIVIIDPTGIARDGVYVLAELDAEFVVRRLQRQSAYWKLTPLNDDYETTDSVVRPGLRAGPWEHKLRVRSQLRTAQRPITDRLLCAVLRQSAGPPAIRIR